MDKLISSRRAYTGRAVNLRVDEVEKPSGEKTTREIVEHSDAIAVIAQDSQGNILLERQYRRAAGKDLLEIPAGGIEPGESPEEAVRREMQEETGFLPQKIERLGGYYLAPGYATEYLHLFLATDLVPARLFADDTEEIKVIQVPINNISQMIADGTIEDGKTLAGLMLYLKRKQP
jgi:ADP-ribose pyrophosphatase